MGNRAIITTPERELGLYLHWNGGRDTVEPLLKYCELKGYRSPKSGPSYAFARMTQVMGNFFGGTLSVGIMPYTTDEAMDPGDNGIYVIDGWEIADHLRTEYDEDWKAVGMRSLEPCEEYDEHEFDDMLRAFDAAMPAGEQLGDYLFAEEVPIGEVSVGDMAYVAKYEAAPTLVAIAGIGRGTVRGRDVTGVPFADLYGGGGDNLNNYLEGPTVRVLR